MTMGPLPMSRTDLIELSLGMSGGYPGRKSNPLVAQRLAMWIRLPDRGEVRDEAEGCALRPARPGALLASILCALASLRFSKPTH